MIVPSKKQFAWQPAWKSSSLPTIRPRTVLLTSVAIIASILVAASIIHPTPLHTAIHRVKDHAVSTFSTVVPNISDSNVSEDARNSTLGFQEVFYISMPERTDRQDAMTLLGDFMDIDMEFQPGVDGEAVPSAGKIIGSQLGYGQFGCWRSHANVWRKIIQDKISTALIFEDDVDFDVDLKDELFRISEGLQNGPNLVDNDPAAPIDQSGPYGTEWDLLFIGYCVHTSKDDAGPENTPFITFKDPSVLNQPRLNSNHRSEFAKFGVDANQTRLLVPLNSYYCSQGYAVSQKGASRLLYNVGYKDVSAPVDNAMSDATSSGALRGIAPIPPLLSQFKVSSDIDSNIDGGDHVVSTTINKEKGHGWGHKKSARSAMKWWAKWKKTTPKATPKVIEGAVA